MSIERQIVPFKLFKEIDFEAYWNRGLKKDVELFVRERGKWINVFESREQGTVSRVD